MTETMNENENVAENEEVVESEEVVETEETPLFMQTDEEGESQNQGVPVDTHIRMKQKLKGRIKENDAELERLRAENESLKAPPVINEPVKPVETDFDDEDKYQDALEEYRDNRTKAILASNQQKKEQEQVVRKFNERISASVDSHFDRAAELVEKHSISPDVYQQATETVKNAMDEIHPNMGTFDVFVDTMGEGSEKTIFAIGRNKTKLSVLKDKLNSDKSGLKAAFFLGAETSRLNGVKSQTSKAPGPGAQISGDESAGGRNAGALKKKFNKLCETGKTKEAFALRRKARKDKIDVKEW